MRTIEIIRFNCTLLMEMLGNSIELQLSAEVKTYFGYPVWKQKNFIL